MKQGNTLHRITLHYLTLHTLLHRKVGAFQSRQERFGNIVAACLTTLAGALSRQQWQHLVEGFVASLSLLAPASHLKVCPSTDQVVVGHTACLQGQHLTIVGGKRLRVCTNMHSCVRRT